MGADLPRVGIAGVGSYLPARVEDAWEAVRDSGISREKFEAIGARTLHRCAPGEQPSDMAATACRRALQDAGIAPGAVDLILYCGSVKDHTRWQAAAKVQSDLGCPRSFVLDIYQGCNGQNLSLLTARAMMRDELGVRTALLCAAERWDNCLERPVLGDSFLFGDGASAAVLRVGHPGYQILGTACRTWGEHHEAFCIPELGAAVRLTPEVIARGGHLFQFYRPRVHTREEILAFAAEVNRVALEMVALACERGGVKPSDITFVVTINASRRHNQHSLSALGLADRRSTVDYVVDTGHLGTGDIFYNLERAIRSGDVRGGDLILFYTGGAGYTWAATVVRA
jgi:3-oxoacyl-[acyl-carrier-protein] synthase-3